MKNDELIQIDGSEGEGGGQILRTALSLSLLTGTPFRLERIRAKRSRPGLLKQHLACVKAAAAIGGARVEGAELGSSTLSFVPGQTRAGSYDWAIGSAGSTSLVLQTVLFPLLRRDGESRVAISGGTHNSMSPPFEFLDRCYKPALEELGYSVSLELKRHGFFPAGGGEIVARLAGTDLGTGAEFRKTVRTVVGMEAWAWSSGIPERIGKAEVELVGDRLGIPAERRHALMVDSVGPGNVVAAVVELEDGAVVFTAFGEPGRPLERVASDCVAQAKRYLESGARVDEHLQDQLLIPLSLGPGGRFTTMKPSLHAETNMDTIRRFINANFVRERRGEDLWEIVVEPAR